MPKDTYALKHQHGSFHDFATELTINREDEVEIETDNAGVATMEAIANGRLVIVRQPKKSKKKEADVT